MAETSPSQEAVQKLEDQLSCRLCLRRYRQPKVLQCLHIFCQDCLQPLVKPTAEGQIVECPQCREATPLPHNGVPGLQRAFFIAGFFDVLDVMKESISNISSTKTGLKCSKHPDKLLKLYCETCKEMICDDCQYNKVHRGHDYDLASEVFSNDKKEVLGIPQPVEQQTATREDALEGLDTECTQIQHHHTMQTNNVHV